jgi:hypothetical protein
MDIDECLRNATELIAPEYFELPVAHDDPVYRERAYCYELYHQLRCEWSPQWPYILTGEVDKRNHPLIRGGALDNVKPDFLVHSPGGMGRNYLVMEVKAIDPASGPLSIDLKKLCAFRNHGEYENAVYLIYGDDSDGSQASMNKLRTVANAIAEQDAGVDLSMIQLWHHSAPGVQAVRIEW